MVFEFLEGTTTEDAAKTLREHRDAPNHTQDAFEEQNRNRLVAGLAPITMEEFTGQTATSVPVKESRNAILKMLQDQNDESLRSFRNAVVQMKKEAHNAVPDDS